MFLLLVFLCGLASCGDSTPSEFEVDVDLGTVELVNKAEIIEYFDNWVA